MERLTKCEALGDKKINFVDGDACFDTWSVPKKFAGSAIDRLAAYEDIGLEPEEMYELLHHSYGPLHKKLGEWIKAEQDGRLVALPCKVGDSVWIVFTPKHPANPADKGKWVMVEDGVQRILYGAKGMSIETWNMGTHPVSKLGKTVFLTREEAEAALVGQEQEAHGEDGVNA